jgi:hypothetical protein
MGDSPSTLGWFNAILTLLSFAGSVASIVVLLNARSIATQLREMQRSYIRQINIPTYIRRLKGMLKNIEEAQSRKNAQRLRQYLSQSRAIVSSLINLIEGDLKSRLQSAERSLDAAVSESNDSSVIRNSSVQAAELHGILTSIENLNLELKWSRSNA